MRVNIINTVFIFITCGLGYNVMSLQVVPERATILYVNEKYMDKMTARVRRYARRSPYYFNIETTIKHTWVNNVSLDFIFLEYLHNEYKRSFIEMRYKFCDMVNFDMYFGKFFASGGLKCPWPPGEYHLMNLTAPTANFPYVFPFEKGRIDCTVVATDTNETIFRSQVEASFFPNKPNIKGK